MRTSYFLLLDLCSSFAPSGVSHFDGEVYCLEHFKDSIERARSDRVGDLLPRKEKSKVREKRTENTIQEVKEISIKRADALSKLVMLDNTIGKVYPGSLLWSASVRDGQLHQLERALGRPEVMVTLVGMKDTFPTNVSERYATSVDIDGRRSLSFAHNGTYSDFKENLRQILAINTASSMSMTADYTVSKSVEDALLSIGLSAKYWGSRMSSKLNHIQELKRTAAIFTLDQVYFSATADAPPLGGYLSDQFLKDNPDLACRIAQGAETGGEVVYVRKVDFGRRVLAALSAEASEEDLRFALSAVIN